jgi:hypothetical protein
MESQWKFCGCRSGLGCRPGRIKAGFAQALEAIRHSRSRVAWVVESQAEAFSMPRAGVPDRPVTTHSGISIGDIRGDLKKQFRRQKKQKNHARMGCHSRGSKCGKAGIVASESTLESRGHLMVKTQKIPGLRASRLPGAGQPNIPAPLEEPWCNFRLPLAQARHAYGRGGRAATP